MSKKINTKIIELKNKLIELNISISNLKSEKLIFNNNDQHSKSYELTLSLLEKENHKNSIKDIINFLELMKK